MIRGQPPFRSINADHFIAIRAPIVQVSHITDRSGLAAQLKLFQFPLPPSVHVDGKLQAANLIRKVGPVYPKLDLSNTISGVVSFSAWIGKDGTVQDLQLMTGHPLLVVLAQDAVKQWVYKPTIVNGEPVGLHCNRRRGQAVNAEITARPSVMRGWRYDHLQSDHTQGMKTLSLAGFCFGNSGVVRLRNSNPAVVSEEVWPDGTPLESPLVSFQIPSRTNPAADL